MDPGIATSAVQVCVGWDICEYVKGSEPIPNVLPWLNIAGKGVGKKQQIYLPAYPVTVPALALSAHSFRSQGRSPRERTLNPLVYNW